MRNWGKKHLRLVDFFLLGKMATRQKRIGEGEQVETQLSTPLDRLNQLSLLSAHMQFFQWKLLVVVDAIFFYFQKRFFVTFFHNCACM